MAREKEVLTRTCGQCIHEWACSMQCSGNPMAQGNAMHCACYEDVKGSTAYFIGTLDGAKGNIPDRLRELAIADKEGRLVVVPDKVYQQDGVRVYESEVRKIIYETTGGIDFDEDAIGSSIFFTREDAEKALERANQ